MSCDAAQQACVEHTSNGALVIVAGPGSGKTHVLCSRIAWLIHAARVPEERILCVTFTTKAAREMHVRVSRMLRREHRCEIRTIHALGYRIANEYHAELGYAGPLHVLDGAPLKQLCADVAAGTNLPEGTHLEKVWARTQQDGHDRAYAECEYYRDLQRALQGVRDALRQQNACDFHDMVHLPLGLVQRNPAVRQVLANRYSHILIDEFQDTSLEQWHLLRSLVDPAHCGVTIVGDINQSIYAFRGADPRVFGAFVDAFPQAEVKSLHRNYRCAQTISDVASALIKNNMVYSAVAGGMDAFTRQLEERQVGVAAGSQSCGASQHAPAGRAGRGDAAQRHCAVARCGSVDDEADLVAKQIEHLAQHSGGGTVGVLCRTHQPLAAVRTALRARGIAHGTKGAQNLHQSPAVKDVLACAALAANSVDTSLLKRVAARCMSGKKANMRAFADNVVLAMKDIDASGRSGDAGGGSGGHPAAGAGVYAALQSLLTYGIPAPQNPHANDALTAKKMDVKKKASPSRQATLFNFKGFKDGKAQSSPTVRRAGGAKGKPLDDASQALAKQLVHVLSGVRRAAKTGSIEAAVRFIVKEMGHTAKDKKKAKGGGGKDEGLAAEKGKTESGSDDNNGAGGASKAVQQLMEAAGACPPCGEEWAAGLRDFCEGVVVSGMDAVGDKGGFSNVTVTMATIHAAKGLEYDYVFVVRCNEGTMPCGSKLAQLPKVDAVRRMQTADVTDEFEQLCRDLKEERRLCYVGMTRAARWVLLSYVADDEHVVSRFVEEVVQSTPGVLQYDTARAASPLPITRAPLTPKQHASDAHTSAAVVLAAAVAGVVGIGGAASRTGSSATLDPVADSGAPIDAGDACITDSPSCAASPLSDTPSESARPWYDHDAEGMAAPTARPQHSARPNRLLFASAGPRQDAPLAGFTSARAVLQAQDGEGQKADAAAPRGGAAKPTSKAGGVRAARRTPADKGAKKRQAAEAAAARGGTSPATSDGSTPRVLRQRSLVDCFTKPAAGAGAGRLGQKRMLFEGTGAGATSETSPTAGSPKRRKVDPPPPAAAARVRAVAVPDTPDDDSDGSNGPGAALSGEARAIWEKSPNRAAAPAAEASVPQKRKRATSPEPPRGAAAPAAAASRVAGVGAARVAVPAAADVDSDADDEPRGCGPLAWAQSPPRGCPEAALVAEVQQGFCGGAKFRVSASCGVCNGDAPPAVVTRCKRGAMEYCDACCCALDLHLNVTYTVLGRRFEERVDFVRAQRELVDSIGAIAPPRDAVARVLLKHSRSLFWSAIYHFGSIADIPSADGG